MMIISGSCVVSLCLNYGELARFAKDFRGSLSSVERSLGLCEIRNRKLLADSPPDYRTSLSFGNLGNLGNLGNFGNFGNFGFVAEAYTGIALLEWIYDMVVVLFMNWYLSTPFRSPL
jgi:hypothetical protein